jgi:hypothetical protein
MWLELQSTPQTNLGHLDQSTATTTPLHSRHSELLASTIPPRMDIIYLKVKKERRNRPGQKFGAKKKSWVWAWFKQDVDNRNVATCEVCCKVVTRLESDKGSPKKLSEHLRTHKLTRDSKNNPGLFPAERDDNRCNLNRTISDKAEPRSLETATHVGEPVSTTCIQRPPLESSHQLQQDIPQLNGEPQLPIQDYTRQCRQILPQRQSYHLSQVVHYQQRYQPSSQHDLLNYDQAQRPQLADDAMKLPKLKNQEVSSLETMVTDCPKHSQNGFRSMNQELSGRGHLTSPYSTMSFHKHLMGFLIENRLSMNIIESSSFKQLIYHLRSDSVADLMDLTQLYSSLLEVSKYDGQFRTNVDDTHLNDK